MNFIFFIFIFYLFSFSYSVEVPSFEISQIDYSQSKCDLSTLYFHFGFLGKATDLTERISFEINLEQPSYAKAECTLEPNQSQDIIYCIVDGFEYDISAQNNIFLPLEDPTNDKIAFTNWEEKITSSTNSIVHGANCPEQKIDYAYSFSKSSNPLKISGCDKGDIKFSISCSKRSSNSELTSNNFNVALSFTEPEHSSAICTVDLDSQSPVFQCKIENKEKKRSLVFTNLSGRGIDDASKYIYIRGDQEIKGTLEKCGSLYLLYSYSIIMMLFLIL